MTNHQVATKLKSILNRCDVESDGVINRKVSTKHGDDIEVLLEHISLLVTDARFNAEASRRELFEARALLEE